MKMTGDLRHASMERRMIFTDWKSTFAIITGSLKKINSRRGIKNPQRAKVQLIGAMQQ
jgi:hypothetical protein